MSGWSPGFPQKPNPMTWGMGCFDHQILLELGRVWIKKGIETETSIAACTFLKMSLVAGL